MKAPFQVYRGYSGNILTATTSEMLLLWQRQKWNWYSCDRDYDGDVTVVIEIMMKMLQLWQRQDRKCYSCDRDKSANITVVTDENLQLTKYEMAECTRTQYYRMSEVATHNVCRGPNRWSQLSSSDPCSRTAGIGINPNHLVLFQCFNTLI